MKNSSVLGKSGSRLFYFGVLCIMSLGPIARAADITWTSSAGIWDAAGNWTPSSVPGDNDRAIFSDAALSNNYAVSVPFSNDVVRDILFNAGTASMNLFVSGGVNPYTLTVTNSFVMDQASAATA